MAKRRKRTSRDVPAKGRLKKFCDQLWALAVHADGGNRCEMCGRRSGLNAHHLISRSYNATRYWLENGLCLCCHCHQFCPDRSPHQSAAGFMLWLKENMPHRHKWLTELTESGGYRQFKETTNAWYYIDIIGTLREYVDDDDYVRIVGKKFAAYLDSRDTGTSEDHMNHDSEEK